MPSYVTPLDVMTYPVSDDTKHCIERELLALLTSVKQSRNKTIPRQYFTAPTEDVSEQLPAKEGISFVHDVLSIISHSYFYRQQSETQANSPEVSWG